MRIGIDIDDTMCRTTEIVHEYIEKYAQEHHLNDLDIMNDEVLKREFFETYIEQIYTNAVIKRSCADVIRRLKNKGNEIYLVSARSDTFFTNTKHHVLEITEEWLKKNGIVVDQIILDAFGDKKAEICKKYHIDIMIDDNPFNYQKILEKGCKCILFDDRAKYSLDENYATNWIEVEKVVEKNYFDFFHRK